MTATGSCMDLDTPEAVRSRNPQSFRTLDFVRQAIHPSEDEPDVPALHGLVRPHVDSFDSIFDEGLLDLAVANLDSKEIMDANGNRISCTRDPLPLDPHHDP